MTEFWCRFTRKAVR
ncbi:Protein of unknown function [Pyronema omphalodes CBS 100304]|uniref:Uncharacterized protein n=1 Tax=Pyronema omphalodes (strain CBS 100304) TaxID=1076935 RepID=U4L3K6_PYROM|nr:Protein of unknown function [Pyronema omphalodes CBS 100304]